MKINSTKFSFILLSALFFLFGFVTVLVDSLIPRIKELFTLNYFQSGLVQFAFFGAYFLVSIPAGKLLAKIGYQKGILTGLLIMALGSFLFYPAASMRVFSIFMLAYFILAAGITILQVAINPYIAVLGSEENASNRLILSQAFNSLGTAIAPLIGAWFILSDKIKTTSEINGLNPVAKSLYLETESSAVIQPFFAITVFILLLAAIFLFVKLPTILSKNNNTSYGSLWKKKNLKLGVFAIFLYVGAEVAIGSYLVNYFLEINLIDSIKDSYAIKIAEFFISDINSVEDSKGILGVFVTFYWTGAMLGRFIGYFLSKKIKASKLLYLFGTSAVILIITSVSTNELTAMWTIIAVGLFNSIMFPTIFTLALGGLSDLKPQASGLLCTAIVGGAIIPPLFGLIIDYSNFKVAFVLILICYSYIIFYGVKNKGKKKFSIENI